MSAPRPRRLATFAELARYLGVADRTGRNYAAKGFFTLYKVPGVRGVLVDLDEVDATIRRLPARVARVGSVPTARTPGL